MLFQLSVERPDLPAGLLFNLLRPLIRLLEGAPAKKLFHPFFCIAVPGLHGNTEFSGLSAGCFCSFCILLFLLFGTFQRRLRWCFWRLARKHGMLCGTADRAWLPGTEIRCQNACLLIQKSPVQALVFSPAGIRLRPSRLILLFCFVILPVQVLIYSQYVLQFFKLLFFVPGLS